MGYPTDKPPNAQPEPPDFMEAATAAAASGPRPGDCWWSVPYSGNLEYTYAGRIVRAAYTRAGVEAFADPKHGSGYAQTRIEPPLALPGQYLVQDGEPVRIEKIAYSDGGFYGRWAYYPFGSAWAPLPKDAQLQPHPRPDHGGPVLALGDAAKLEILRLGDARLQQIVTATAQTLELQKETAAQEKARQARLAEEEKKAKADAEAKKAKIAAPIRILEETAEGAKDGAAASAFVYAARKFADAYSEHIPAILLTDRGRTAIPWLLCVTTYLATWLIPGLPLAPQLQALSLRATRGSAALMMAHIAESIAPLMDRIVTKGRELMESE